MLTEEKWVCFCPDGWWARSRYRFGAGSARYRNFGPYRFRIQALFAKWFKL